MRTQITQIFQQTGKTFYAESTNLFSNYVDIRRYATTTPNIGDKISFADKVYYAMSETARQKISHCAFETYNTFEYISMRICNIILPYDHFYVMADNEVPAGYTYI